MKEKEEKRNPDETQAIFTYASESLQCVSDKDKRKYERCSREREFER